MDFFITPVYILILNIYNILIPAHCIVNFIFVAKIICYTLSILDSTLRLHGALNFAIIMMVMNVTMFGW